MQVLPGLLPLLLSKQILKEENYSRLLRPDDGAECAPPPHARTPARPHARTPARRVAHATPLTTCHATTKL